MSNSKDTNYPLIPSVGLLILRVSAGGLLAFGHGWNKLTHFSDVANNFADPIGLGVTTSLVLTVFAEFFCSIAVMLGAATRLAAVPPLVTMLVAAGIFHSADPWSKKEFPLLYAVLFLTVILTGPGGLSLDAIIHRVKR